MELSAAEVWDRIREGVQGSLPEQAFRTWLAPTQAVAISQDLLVVSAPTQFAADWVEDKYAELLMAVGERLFGRRWTLSLQARAGGAAEAPAAPAHAAPQPPPVQVTASRPQGPPNGKAPSAAGGPGASAPLNPKYSFDRFVVGNNNQLATAAAHAVAEAPARTYNPFFIYGGVGLGKTHLMHAIGHAMLARDPGKRVMYLSSERFTNELVSAIQEGSMAEFRRQYRQIDLLLVDDIQFLEGKERTQEEFFHTFNALHDAQKQIVLTSDRPPKGIGLEDRLISRFEWGLVADIKAPDFETRMAILRKKMEDENLQLADADEVLTYISQVRTSSVRELEGAVTKLLAHSSLTRREIDVDFAREVLGGGPAGDGGRGGIPGSGGGTGGGFSPEEVRRRVAEAWGTTPEALQSKKRTKDLTVPRQVAMFLIKETFDVPLVEIGRLFGGRDHSTVIHSVAKVEEEMRTDPGFRQRVEQLRGALRSPP